MFDFDPFDLDSPENFVLVTGSGLLDDDRDDGQRCTCWCGCRRPVTFPGDDRCEQCQREEHWDEAEDGP